MALTKKDLTQIRHAVREEIDTRVRPIVKEEIEIRVRPIVHEEIDKRVRPIVKEEIDLRIEPLGDELSIHGSKIAVIEERTERLESKIDRIWKAIDEDLISTFNLIDKLSKKVKELEKRVKVLETVK